MKVSVVGLGYVGFPFLVTILDRKKNKTEILGIEENSKIGEQKIKKIQSTKRNYFKNKKLDSLFIKNKKKFNISTNYNLALNSDYIFICLPFNIDSKLNTNDRKYFKLIEKYYLNVKKNCTLILNSTVPPGYSTSIIKRFKKKNKFRGADVKIVYSPERVEPGINYYNSIVNTPRVFSTNGNPNITKEIKGLFRNILNFKKLKLVELQKYEEAEFCKVLENSYRAANIAFMEEWGVLAENLKINIFPVIEAIKMRKTHQNIMKPGLGVGGYCLTKDPFFAKYSSKNYSSKKTKFPFIDLTMNINLKMHLRSIRLINSILKKYDYKKILMIGLSYTNNVDDIRNSRAIDLVESININNRNLTIYEKSINQRQILGKRIVKNVPNINNFNLIILVNKSNINFKKIKKKISIVDLNNILTNKEIEIIKKKANLFILGRGDI